MNILPVILSGGAGTRLWPESRKAFPKPFMTMPDGETLIQKTLQRAQALAGGGPILTVTNEAYVDLARKSYVDCGSEATRHVFLLEPQARNTAPAIALASAWAGQNLGDDVCLVILPSDHLIADLQGFVAAAGKAAQLASDGYLVTFGIAPSRAETGYGYIKSGDALEHGFKVEKFVEKPDLKTAQEYVSSGQYLWNSGMFAFTPGVFQDAAREVAEELAEVASECLSSAATHNNEVRFETADFSRLPAISVDYAVFEKARNVAVNVGTFDWNDVGSWQAISDLNPGGGNHAQGNALFVQSDGVYVRGNERLVATVGVNDLIVVDTPDALLISSREASQNVKEVVDQLNASNSPLTHTHSTTVHLWGSSSCLWADEDQIIQRIAIHPGAQFEPATSQHGSLLSVLKGHGRSGSMALERGQTMVLSTAVSNQGDGPLVVLVTQQV